MINFCTLFNSNYLTRGIALHQSLVKVCKEFHLYIVAFDNESYVYLSGAGLPNVTVISMAEFEDEALLSVKSTRTAAEYCWTSTSSLILYCINTFNLDACTYVDADMIFYQDPVVLIKEAGTNSVIITEHRYSKEYDVSKTHGIYCVQFMYFRSDERGMKVLNWWRDRCIEWCFNRQEDGKFGDQKYLDDWTTRFEGVHVIKHPGGGLAPWNIQQFDVSMVRGSLMIENPGMREKALLIFFHFHGLKFYTDAMVSYTGTLYDISEKQKELIYRPYVSQLVNIAAELKKNWVEFNTDGAKTPAPTKRKTFFEFLREKSIVALKGNLHALNPKSFNFSRHYHFVKIPILK
ncbi:MAG: glycosyl transferase [Sphingobacteriales bacterium]|nr:MAG: glycosyl transferase [Sphingobacteriales bacterium]